jgi:drug/metabolite transporter (DMT)-like permease
VAVAREAPPTALSTAGSTAVAMCAFAANSLLCRAALGGHVVDPLTFTLVRLASGALVLVLLARGRPAPGGRPLVRAGMLFAYALGFSLAYTRIAAAVGALLLFGAVQVTMIASALLAGERLRPAQTLGFLVSVAGMLALTRPGLEAPDLLGAVLMVGAGAAWGGYSLHGRGSGDPLAATAAGFAWSVPLGLLASAVGWPVVAPHVTATGLALAATSGAITSGLGYAVWYAALRGLTATQGAMVQLSVPPLAALGAVVFLGETLGVRLVASGAAILGGIALAVRAPRA